MKKNDGKMRSRKLWVTIGGITAAVLTGLLDFPEAQAKIIVQGILGMVGAYSLGQGYVDGQRERARPSMVMAAEK